MKAIQSFVNQTNFDRILNLHGIIGKDYDYEGYDDLKLLYDINKIFSNNPYGEIIDRTGNTKYPFKIHVRLPWKIPYKPIELETACENRVKEITTTDTEYFYIYWSGGIDSTLMLVSFLKLVDHNKITVILSDRSIGEYPDFYHSFIKDKLKVLTLADVIPEDNGVHITGDPADTIWAILDHSFIEGEAGSYLYKPYTDWFRYRGADDNFLEKTDDFMRRSGRTISTLFEARWWYYLNCKSQSKCVSITSRFNINKNYCAFYESYDFDTWSFYNTDHMILGNDWKTYKYPAKKIIYNFDKNLNYLTNKSKDYSDDPINQLYKTPIVFRNTPLFVTDDYHQPTLSSGFFFSENIYKQDLYETYKHLFMPT
jgi:hypothetical protein